MKKKKKVIRSFVESFPEEKVLYMVKTDKV